MAISYDTAHASVAGVKLSPALAQLGAINESFQQEGISVLNEGFSEVASNQHYFQDYVSRLSEGLEPGAAEEFAQLAQNTRTQILQESAIDGVNPVTALSLPMLRVAYPKTAIREGFPTEPVLQPKFKVTWLKPYVVDSATNEKVYLPKAVKTHGNLFKLQQVQSTAINVGAAGVSGHDLLTPVGGNAALGDAIDPNFRVIEVAFKALDAAGSNAETVTVHCDLPLDTNINVVEGEVSGAHSDGTVNTVRVFAKVDRRAGTMDVVGLGREVVTVKVLGYISSEANNRATQVGFDITPDETVIGTGQPIESPINIQHMTDVMAMYNIDSTVRTLEIMSTSLAQSTDLEGIAFLARRWEMSPQRLKTSFDVQPPANYALGNTAWREELKIKIDNLVTRLMQSTNITAGQVVIFGNPIDTQVLHNVRWTYAADEQPNGVNIEYRVGSYTSGVTTYKVLSSFNFDQGSLYVCFIPTAPDQQTLKYYPYSFNVVRGTASPNKPYVPSISMLKRHAFKEYSQMIGKVEILNNTGE
jgi:hypothetical protein